MFSVAENSGFEGLGAILASVLVRFNEKKNIYFFEEVYAKHLPPGVLRQGE